MTNKMITPRPAETKPIISHEASTFSLDVVALSRFIKPKTAPIMHASMIVWSIVPLTTNLYGYFSIMISTRSIVAELKNIIVVKVNEYR